VFDRSTALLRSARLPIDLASPLVTAWELAQAWPNSELVIVHGAGHAAMDPGMSEAFIAATDRFTTRR
jgi:proline iminopeptidase